MGRSVVRPTDLTPEARKRYADQLGDAASTRSRPRPSRAGTGDGQPCAGSCQCGQGFERFTDWERHARQSGHSRWSTDLPQERST